ncbi:hypothetical protein L1987_88132 [Smallanthus sonchifolius]|nr:hypothetical protein L1987_89719 [Smallanthus sonchifolius]KAI3668341.1 hypothetical protein L1987_88686 [Smallanthus sonchifolius]KAI3668838.1 hypothetical protein L1987_88132 [Smallanthus sonchifolius]
MLLRCVPDTEKSLPQHEAVVHPKTTIPYVTDRIQESLKAEEIERELSSFLSSFGNRGVTSSVLQNTKIKLQLDVASPAKLLKIRELMRDLQSRPVPAFQARDALLKALAQWERDQTRDP